ncbi:Lysine--tRNA ligase [Candidatus Ecksteinia adelgidicola]|nr:Lysine--tRNA ligase [Candidatus Ecksteinia adelgidicola]
MFKQKLQDANQMVNLNNELQCRREKLAILRKQGTPFPNDFHRDSTSDKLHAAYDQREKKELETLNIIVMVAGRIMSRRIMGKASFITLQDIGGFIQLYISLKTLTSSVHDYNKEFKKWDLGDIIGARGKVFKTKSGELSIFCEELRLLTKTLRPLPDKFHGLTNKEARYRQRYLDLIINKKSRKTFQLRSKIITLIRNFMIERDFIEVETPMMQTIPGGASARPFITHHNALDIDMYLRISPELYLKRLVIGGFERVFEINRNFRNEGISSRHYPEFTMMELYMAYADYKDLFKLIETLFQTLAKAVLNTYLVKYGNKIFDFSKSFKKLTMIEAIHKYYPDMNLNNIKTLTNVAQSFGIQTQTTWGLGRIIASIFDKVIISHLIQPTFITEYPAEVSPLARRNDCNSEIADRFELFINGHEIGNGFSELNDSEDQKKIFVNQIINRNTGDEEAIFYDEDYITALEHGLPPTAGLGIGIDRIIMLFTNNHAIRDVILFPTMRK